MELAEAGFVDVLLGGGAPEDVALIENGGRTTFGELAHRVGERAGELDLPVRSVVVLPTSNTVDSVVTYLALLAAGHVPLLTGDHADSLAAAWDVDAVVRLGPGGCHIERRTVTSVRHLHPDLALLLSTSGSTGAPKLVRLSHRNLASNAVAIAEYLGLTPGDRGITSLPLHYCYGLSVLHSHLAAGAGVVVTAASVVDPCFTAAMADGGVTNLAGVPHTFELLERAGPERIHVPSLRFLTQAGGRMDPQRVTRWAARSERWGVELFVMYGQTEATARMAYLPPRLVAAHPEAIGRPIPGGHLELRPVAGAPDDVGELVYRGPNVMLGYATTPDDLALGATLDELRTGDLARFHPGDDGIYEIVGRRARFVKPFGLRIDLDHLEAVLVETGIDAAVAGDDARLVVGSPGVSPHLVARRVAALTGVPVSAVLVDSGPVPRTGNGKVDYRALARRADERADAADGRTVAGIFRTVLGVEAVAPTATFVTLGGDSLSYVECSVRLERLIGRLPDEWHLRSVADLQSAERRAGLPRLDTTALLRAAGVLAIVATHMRLWYFPGGAHLLLAVVGYNVSRFHLTIDDGRQRARAALRTIARTAMPVAAFVAVCMLLVGGYGLATLVLVNNYLGPPRHLDGRWHYWFIEAMVQLLLIVAVVLSIGPVRRLDRRFQYLVPLAALGVALVLREQWQTIDGTNNLRFQTHGVAWLFALGWLVHRSTTWPSRLLTTGLCVVTVPGFFGRPEREWFIIGGLALLLWIPAVPLPRLGARAVAVVAAASMGIFITHFRVFPPLDRTLPRGVAFAVTVAVGVVAWCAAEQAVRILRPALRRARSRQFRVVNAEHRRPAIATNGPAAQTHAMLSHQGASGR